MSSKRTRRKPIDHDMVEFKEDHSAEELSKAKRRRPKWKADASDDSFQYGPKIQRGTKGKKQGDQNKTDDLNKPQKLKKKNEKIQKKEQEKIKKISHPKQERRTIQELNTEYVIKYVDPIRTGKQIKERKIFNPDQYHSHVEQKLNQQKKLATIQEEFGIFIPKIDEAPKVKLTAWDHLLKHIIQIGTDRLEERETCFKLSKKIARYAQLSQSKIQLIQVQKQKEEEKKIKRTATTLWRLVDKDYWRSVGRVGKYIENEERKKQEKQVQAKRLQQLVQKQLQASTKISKLIQGFSEIQLNNLQVSNVVVPPIVLVLKLNPMQIIGVEEDKVIRQPLLIKHPLREYQLLGMHWIYALHNRKMNGILADEMGLGKTIQTISFLAHLALTKGVWGPHLVVVPTSIIVNWEIQFKRWCPAFKIMTYYGTPRERKAKRKGWSKLNSFHVCITSYKIVVTDQAIFKRKKWYYMILDQAQNIKNYKSQRWQVLLNFNSKNRLLLTGTPLQNDISELWSLLHFLMPKLFVSFSDFNQWFNLPFQQALQKNYPISQQILKKLHTILRPFFLRRLKKDVEKQLPQKTQVIIRCPLSRRQKYLYDQFIAHQNKKHNEVMGMMNILMQLKKVCNHPDLFIPRAEDTPLRWPHTNFIVATFALFIRPKLSELSSPSNNTIEFNELALQLIHQYQSIKFNKFSSAFYDNLYKTKMECMRVNYERSRWKPFQFHNFSTYNIFKIQPQQPLFVVNSLEDRIKQSRDYIQKFLFVVPKVQTYCHELIPTKYNNEYAHELTNLEECRQQLINCQDFQLLHPINSKFHLHLPDKSSVLYDCGKLVKMVQLLKKIKSRGQKTLIFTQMTKMLDIFQKIMNMYRFNYVRLDGGTKTEVRQQLVERFNNDPRVMVFISSTRSGGIGLNLTGASNVIFYDTDWNPAMDRQAQDRCHRIGQTRNVTIYRLIAQHTIEENILMKSIHKRKLDELVTEEGMFNTKYFEKVNLKDMLDGVIHTDNLEGDLAEVEDDEDRKMLKDAQMEGQNDNDFAKDHSLDVQNLPRLFTYGLELLKINQLQAQQSSEQQIDQDEQHQQQQEQAQIQEQEMQEEVFQQKQASDKEDQLYNTNEEDGNSRKITDLERYNGIVTYQRHYNFMKQHFYN